MTDVEIRRLIRLAKQISDPPSKTWRSEENQRRKDFRLVSVDGEHRFRAFARQSLRFQENFSIGLEYEPSDGTESLVLLRCNGPHGVFNRGFDEAHPHYHFHVHRATEEAMTLGEKPESRAEITSEFGSVKEAMRYFLSEVAVDANDQDRYFADDLKVTLFDSLELFS